MLLHREKITACLCTGLHVTCSTVVAAVLHLVLAWLARGRCLAAVCKFLVEQPLLPLLLQCAGVAGSGKSLKSKQRKPQRLPGITTHQRALFNFK